MTWQPIETAPRDGLFLGWLDWQGLGRNEVVIGGWDEDAAEWRFMGGIAEVRAVSRHFVSHWMPLPEPPNPSVSS